MTPLPNRPNERGIALVSAMLMLVLAMVMTATFMLTVVGERTTSTGVHLSRRATFAADAGVRAMQQQLANSARGRLDTLTNAWTGTGNIITSPGTFFGTGPITMTCANPGFNATATVAYLGDSIGTTSQCFDYRWTITSNATSGSGARRTVQSTGTMRVSASRGSFSDYLVYTNHHTAPGGGTIWFTSRTRFDGRVHTNGQLAFAYEPTFGDLVTSVSQTAQYNNTGSPVELDESHNGTIDVPDFQGGFQRGVAAVNLPSNAFSQQNAALGLSPANTTAPDNTTVNTYLGNGALSSAPANGIYVPTSAGAVSGGIYVQGDLDDCLLSVDGAGRQVYTLVQGGTTRTITVNNVTHTTSIFDGTNTVNYTGTPRGMLYVAGAVRQLRGPARNMGMTVPAIARDTKLLVTATNDIVLTNDLVCANYDDKQNVLGLFTPGGSVRVATSAPDDMNLDAFVMATEPSSGIFTVDNYSYGEPRGTFHLRGGMVTQFYGAFGTFRGETPKSGYGRDFQYDRRGLEPPFFPTTGRFNTNRPIAHRESWIEM